ncbi:MAG: hypothetical protein GXP26_08710 [Planctomycetes bacterium]|nr:hypothetical protein [Planctomycetota bacterium]
MEWLTDPEHWAYWGGWVRGLVLLAVPLAGALLLKLLARLCRSKKQYPLVNDWWEYHFSKKDGELCVLESKIRITLGIINVLRVGITQGAGLSYAGCVRVEKGTTQFLLQVRSKNPDVDEFAQYRYENSIDSSPQLFIGINTSYVHERNAYASSSIMSAIQLDLDTAETKLKETILDTHGLPILLLKKQLPAGTERSAEAAP